MGKPILDLLVTESKHLDQAGLLRREPSIGSAPGPAVEMGGKELTNLASGDYLGLAAHPEVKKAAKAAIDTWGVGLASPRMLTGNIPLHAELEKAVSDLLGTEETLVFSSGYHATTGLFESMLTDRDYVFCDELADPSIADGIRLSRARVFSYRTNDMDHLEDRLKRSRQARFRVIATDGAFPLSGTTANLPRISELAAKYDATVVVDDRHGIGVMGKNGRGTADKLGVAGKVDLITGSFGVALGGGAGGFVSGKKPIIAWLRQKSRPHIVSTALMPAAAAAAVKAIEVARGYLGKGREQLVTNVQLFRSALTEEGLSVIEGEHPAVAVLLGDAVVTQRVADLLYKKGIFVMGFCHPVVPEGAARILAQVSTRHSQKSLREVAKGFAEAFREAQVKRTRA